MNACMHYQWQMTDNTVSQKLTGELKRLLSISITQWKVFCDSRNTVDIVPPDGQISFSVCFLFWYAGKNLLKTLFNGRFNNGFLHNVWQGFIWAETNDGNITNVSMVAHTLKLRLFSGHLDWYFDWNIFFTRPNPKLK